MEEGPKSPVISRGRRQRHDQKLIKPRATIICRKLASHKFDDKIVCVDSPVKLGRGSRGDDKDVAQDNGFFPSAALVVSRFHATLQYSLPLRKFFIIDQESSNGTFLDNRKLEPLVINEIRCGSIVQLGDKKKMKDGSFLSPIVAYFELSPCNCTNHDSQVMDTMHFLEEGDDQQNCSSFSSRESVSLLAKTDDYD